LARTLKGLLYLVITVAVLWVILIGIPQGLQMLGVPPAALPHIQLPAESLSESPLFSIGGQPYYLTNTLIATLIADLILIGMAVAATRNIREVPRGWQNTFEAILEALNGFVEQVAGPVKGRRIFPWMATIFLLLLVANWMELIPGVDSIGLIHHAEADKGIAGHEVRQLGGGVYILDVDPQYRKGRLPAEGEELFVVTPFVRAAATDLNLTIGLALTAVVAIQVFGISALGPDYFSKFLNLKALGGGGVMDFIVGLLESVAEVAKIISFGFRLFGNIFAGQVLLFVMAFLIPFFLPVIFYGLELFVGAIQAFVFGMLTLVFVTMAMAAHHDEEAEHH
jgi:F-type H+-transporting ATPase subunit a